MLQYNNLIEIMHDGNDTQAADAAKSLVGYATLGKFTRAFATEVIAVMAAKLSYEESCLDWIHTIADSNHIDAGEVNIDLEANTTLSILFTDEDSPIDYLLYQASDDKREKALLELRKEDNAFACWFYLVLTSKSPGKWYRFAMVNLVDAEFMDSFHTYQHLLPKIN